MSQADYELPAGPPALDERVALSGDQTEQARDALAVLSASLDGLPVVLSQQGEVICVAGVTDNAARQIARAAERAWQGGGAKLARELLRFNEDATDPEDPAKGGRNRPAVYSVHVAGALIVSVGWRQQVGLGRLRREVSKARRALQGIVG
jgi:hypothetical protein